MTDHSSNRHLPIIVLALALTGQNTAAADQLTDEHVRLATLIRELNAIDRIAASGETVSDLGTSRYHFDYTRLREDIARVTTGLKQYLAPQRASPREGIALYGSYRLEGDTAQ